ncbi:MAG: hypothetical protein U0Y82_03705 [Thermoleophilia bacterium]
MTGLPLSSSPSWIPRRRTVLGLALAAALCTAAPAVGADPILPLSGVQAGMTGTAYTVVHGTDITTFPVTILDVVGPGVLADDSLILARAQGPLMTETGGVAEGMSGSPVYVTGADGVARVIGAIAYGTADEASTLIGITPIENMLNAASGAQALERPVAGAARPVRIVKTRAAAGRLQRAHPAVRAMYPLQAWSVAGIDPRLLPLARRALGSDGVVQQALPRTLRPAVALTPGASMTVLGLAGDMVFGAIGTVTYVEGSTVLGFGHPFVGAGATRLMLGDGYIYSVVSAPIRGGSYKLGEPGTVQGMLTGDRRNGVVGQLGPVSAINVHTVAHDSARNTTTDMHVQLAAMPELAPNVAPLLQAQPLLLVRDGITSGTLDLRITLRGGDLPRPVVYHNVYAATGEVASVSGGVLATHLAELMQNGTRVLVPGDIEITQSLVPEIKAARIVSARLLPAHATPGRRAMLRLVLQAYRADRVTVTVPVRVPTGFGPGSFALRVVPNDDTGFDPSSADLTAMGGPAAPLRTARAVARANALLAAGVPRANRTERVLHVVRKLGQDQHNAVRLLGPGEEADKPGAGVRVTVPGWVISGGRAVVRVK